MEWLKKHADAAVTTGILLTAIIFMSNQFSKINERFAKIDERLNKIEQELAVIKAVLVMKDILPKTLVQNKREEIKNFVK